MRDARWLESRAFLWSKRYFEYQNLIPLADAALPARSFLLGSQADHSGSSRFFGTIGVPPEIAVTSYSLTASPTTVTEGNQVTFTITRSGDKPAETVYFSTLSDGTATYGEGDYSTTSGGSPANIAVTFSSGTTSRTVTLNILSDGVSDSGEQFRAIVQRNASDPVSTYLDRSSYVTINDAAPSTTYSLTASPTTVTEGNQVTFTITRSGDKPAETVYFSTLSDGTATYAEGDYTTTSGGQPANIAVSFSSGTTSRTVTLNIVSDGVSDSGEQFRAIVQRSASDPVSTYLDRSSYVTINDAAASTTYSLTPSLTTVVEGNQITFTITRSGDKPAETIYFSTLADGTATYAEGDYTTTSGGQPANMAVSFSSGETSETVTLNIVNDGVSDSGEQFRAIIQRSSADPVSTYLDRSSFVTINDAAAQNTTYSLTPASTTVTEGGQLVFTITRSGDKPGETVYFSTLADGTATYAEGDYTTTAGGQPANVAVVFASGVTSQTVTLNIVNDGVSDSGEQFRAIVQRNSSDPVSTYLSRSDFVTINDAVLHNTTYSLAPSASSVTEGNQVTFTITRAGDKPAETIYFSTLSSGTATYAEGDYTTSSGGKPENMPIIFQTGETQRTVTLSIREDNVSDTGEQFRAIVQRNASDSASVYLDRSSYVVINDVTHSAETEDTAWYEGITQYLPTFVYVAQASGSQIRLAGFRYPVSDSGIVTERPDTADSWYIAQDLGTRLLEENLNHPTHPYYHLGEDWNHSDGENGQYAVAVYGGTLVKMYNHNEFGNVVVLEHTLPNGDIVYSLYAHLENFAPELIVGSGVQSGQRIGLIGSSGAVAQHLHFELFSADQGKTFNDYLTSGVEGHYGYAHNEGSPQFASDAGPVTSYTHYSSLGFTWYNPSIFIDRHKDFLVSINPERDNTTNVFARGVEAVLEIIEEGKEIVLNWFEEIRVQGSDFIDRIRILSLFGTTIEHHTIYFDGGAGDDIIDGSQADRRIVAEGGLGADTFTGGAGQDQFLGGEGDDAYFVDAGDTVIELAGEGYDIVYAASSYVLVAGSGVEVLATIDNTATTAINLTGNELRNYLVGNAGANLLDGGAGGADQLWGREGDDSYLVDGDDLVVEYAGHGYDIVYARASHALAAGFEIEVLATIDNMATTSINLTGNELANYLVGNAGANTLDGGAGGADQLWGREGDDSYFADGDDLVVEYAGHGYDIVYARASHALAAGFEIEVLATADNLATTAINLTGNERDNYLVGNAGANTLDGGGGGADQLWGREGDDSYFADSNDLVVEYAGHGYDILYARSSYALAAGFEIEVLATANNLATTAISLTGNELGNYITGNAGANTLDGGPGGADLLWGREGDDSYLADGNDTVVEHAGQGYDIVYARSSFALAVGMEIEVLGTADNLAATAIDLKGNELSNYVTGNAGANVIDGGAGSDSLHGRGGADSFAFTSALGGGNIDTIFDFGDGADRFLLDDAVFAGLGLGALGAGAFRTGSAAQDADDRIVYNNATGQLFYDADGNGSGAQVLFATLTYAPTLSASDFTVI